MSVSITGKLNKPASEFAAGESVGFGIRLGQQYYDRETKQKEWTNYEAVVFAKAQAQIDFYRQALVEGAVVEVLGKRQKIRTFEGNNGTILSIEIIDASLESVNTGGQTAQSAANPPQQGGFNQPAQQAPQPQPQSFGSFGAAPVASAPAATWENVEPAGEPAQKGATIDQIKAHEQVGGDINKALALGWVADSSIPF